MSLAYAFSASMSWTASPGMRRGSVNTMSEAISNDGIAISNRLTTYRLSTRPPRAWPRYDLAIEPGRQQAPAVVVSEVGSVVLQGAFPDGDVHAGRRRDVVLLLG